MPRIIPIIIVIILIALILGGYFLLWPKYQEFKSKKLEVETKDENIRQKGEYLSRLESNANKLSEYANELSKIDTALSVDPSKPNLYNFILKTSAENGLILNSVDIGEVSSEEEEIQKIPLSISVSGSYPAFKNFLSVIYKNTRLFEINSISFSSPGETEEGRELFIFSLVFETHVYKEAEVGEAEMGEEGISL